MSNAQLRAQVEALRERIRIEKADKAVKVAGATDEYVEEMLMQERDRLKAELASVMGVSVDQVEVPEGVVLTEEVAGASTVVPEGVTLPAGTVLPDGTVAPEPAPTNGKKNRPAIDPNAVVVHDAPTDPSDPAAPGVPT